MMIILVAGKARAGKDTFADVFLEQADFFDTLKTSYAEPLKKAVSSLLGISLKELEDTKDCFSELLKAKPRKLLQELGTDLIRNRFNKSFFIDRIRNIQGYDFVVVPDCRFEDELALKDSWTVKIKIKRNHVSIENSSHESEKDLPDELFDYIITNDGTLEDYKTTCKHVSQSIIFKDFLNKIGG